MKSFKQKVMLEVTFDRMVTEKEARWAISHCVESIKIKNRIDTDKFHHPKIRNISTKEGNRVIESALRAYRKIMSNPDT